MRVLYFPPGDYAAGGLRPISPPPPRPPTAVGVAEPDEEGRWVNVKDCGAKGDGVTDDTDAINRAIDALNGAP